MRNATCVDTQISIKWEYPILCLRVVANCAISAVQIYKTRSGPGKESGKSMRVDLGTNYYFFSHFLQNCRKFGYRRCAYLHCNRYFLYQAWIILNNLFLLRMPGFKVFPMDAEANLHGQTLSPLKITLFRKQSDSTSLGSLTAGASLKLHIETCGRLFEARLA